MVRDLDRIDRIVDLLREAWHANPDWRLGQLVSNSLGAGVQDVFFPEDFRFERGLRAILSGDHFGPDPSTGEPR
ncbi:MAG TPA: hypothetical protein VMH41_16870 [Mycobacteriales bacterium]|nr:hypothetical protein [Mycobacteriales bacterium]